jgi:hypothetical protein
VPISVSSLECDVRGSIQPTPKKNGRRQIVLRYIEIKEHGFGETELELRGEVSALEAKLKDVKNSPDIQQISLAF